MIRRGALGAVVTGILLTVAPLTTASPGAPSAEPVEIARLVIATPVRARPTSQSPLVTRLAAVRPITLQQTALPVLRRDRNVAGEEWLLVGLPGRPVGRTGWILSSNTVIARSAWRVVIDRRSRLARVYRLGRLAQTLPVVIGKPSTPTPRGRYFVVEHVRQSPGSVLGPWALATSAYSHVLQEFDGGPGQIALHGRGGALLQDPLGTAASHGCIRFDNVAIRELSRVLPNGTPIEIV